MSGAAIPPPAAQITICGALKTETIAALVELAMTAGAALLVQPRTAIVATPPSVVDVPPAQRALPPLRRRASRRATGQTRDRRDAGDLAPAVREFLAKRGPVKPGVLASHLKLTVFVMRQRLKDLASRGVVELTGTTLDRRVGLPGQRAKEAP